MDDMDLRNQLQELSVTVAALSADLKNINARLSAVEDNNARLSADLKNSNAVLKNINARWSAVEDNNETLTTELENTNARWSAELNDTNATFSAQLTNTNAELNDFKSRLQDVEVKFRKVSLLAGLVILISIVGGILSDATSMVCGVLAMAGTVLSAIGLRKTLFPYERVERYKLD